MFKVLMPAIFYLKKKAKKEKDKFTINVRVCAGSYQGRM